MPSIKRSTLLLDNLKNLLSVICNLHFAYVILELAKPNVHALLNLVLTSDTKQNLGLFDFFFSGC